MKKFNVLFLLVILSLICFSNQFVIERNVFDSGKLDFIPHTGKGAFSNYLTMEIPFEPVRKVYLQLVNVLGKKLKNRGEAHITVITPPEYDQIKKFINIEEINSIAVECNIQDSKFRVSGIGKGIMENGNKPDMETYYIVVESYNLLNIRVRILKKILENGGDISVFDPYAFYPHITLGFTHRDLHIQDGVIKDENSIIFGLEIK